VEALRDVTHREVDACYPGLTFLQVLFGYRSHDELHACFPDCYAEEPAHVLINALFPKAAAFGM